MNGFKPGVWVTHGKNLHRVLKVDINQDNGDYVCIVDIPYFTDTWLSQSKFKLWSPKQNEWCWFWDYANQPALGKSNGVTPNSENCDFYMGNISYPYNIPHLFQGFIYCELYIGQLPSVIRDNK